MSTALRQPIHQEGPQPRLPGVRGLQGRHPGAGEGSGKCEEYGVIADRRRGRAFQEEKAVCAKAKNEEKNHVQAASGTERERTKGRLRLVLKQVSRMAC